MENDLKIIVFGETGSIIDEAKKPLGVVNEPAQQLKFSEQTKTVQPRRKQAMAGYTDVHTQITAQLKKVNRERYLKQIERDRKLSEMLPAERVDFLRKEQQENERWAAEYATKAFEEKQRARLERQGFKFAHEEGE